MCFEGKGIIARRRRAKEDIYVFKLCKYYPKEDKVWPYFFPEYMETPYKEGGIYTARLGNPNYNHNWRKRSFNYEIHEGIHSYGHADTFISLETTDTGGYIFNVESFRNANEEEMENPLHATMVTPDENFNLMINGYDDTIITTVMGIIPKGAHYYKNRRGVYVSDKFIVTKVNIERMEP